MIHDTFISVERLLLSNLHVTCRKSLVETFGADANDISLAF